MTDAVPFPDGSRILHIGLPKTGTTALQGALFAAKVELLEHGVHYPPDLRHPYLATTAAAMGNRSWFKKDHLEKWHRIADDMRTSEARVTVLSSEALSKAGPGRVREIIEAIGPDPQVVVTARPLAKIVPSVWQMRVGAGSTTALSEFVDDVFSDNPSREAKAPLERYALDRYLKLWGDVVGVENLTFVIVDPVDRSMLLHSFERLLGLPADFLQAQPGLLNDSLPFPELEMVRHLNQLDETTFRPGDNPQRRQGRLLRGAATSFEKHPIRISRAAAEACNAATRPWIDAVAESSANVVGSLSHLIVDPTDYPETAEVPTTVSTESAATIAHFLQEYTRSTGTPSERQEDPVEQESEAAVHESTSALGSLDQVPTGLLAKELRSRARSKLARRFKR